tara:strand:+ start:307 stop:528 length:222 start_codon:yes stop_codon:yes gene_type:complete
MDYNHGNNIYGLSCTLTKNHRGTICKSRNVNTVETSVYLFLRGVPGKLTGEGLLGLRVHEHDVLTTIGGLPAT